MLLLTAMFNSAQSQTVPQETKATNAADALSNCEWLNAKLDTMNYRQDSMMKVYEQRIEKMLQDQKKREAKKPN